MFNLPDLFKINKHRVLRSYLTEEVRGSNIDREGTRGFSDFPMYYSSHLGIAYQVQTSWDNYLVPHELKFKVS